MIKSCFICKIDFDVKKSHFERRVCCSKKCSIENQKNKTGKLNNNYKGIKEQKCTFCNIKFIPKNPYHKRKFCSTKCSSNSTIGRKVILHENTLKYIKRKIEDGKNNPKKKCECDNKKGITSKKCIACFHKTIERKNKCLICGIIHKKAIIVKTCSKKCSEVLRKRMYVGENNPNWQGGIMSDNKKQRQSDLYKNWRLLVFERDKYTCQDCGIIGNTLHSHHIKSFSKHKELRFDINNGLTLCFNCHKKLHKNMNLKS